MPPWYDPKSLTDSLELDYFMRPRALSRWWPRCMWAAGGIALLYVAWALWPSHHDALQAGPLTTPHAMWSADCGKCHTEAFATAARLLPGHHAWRSTPDAACLQCHPGPDHNRLVTSENCATCHKEHRGHPLLARPNDGHCSACHADLKARFGESHFENVASFAKHPEFALWRGPQATDPGNVEFNHRKHLQLRAEDKLVSIGPAVARLQHMQCAFCHQPDPAGKYMQPIQFAKHCQECHPLLVRADDGRLPESLKDSVRAFQQEPVPHPAKGQTPAFVRAVVRERLLKFAQKNAALLELKVVPQEDWMVLPGLSRPGEPATAAQLDWVNERWKNAEGLFFDKSAGCALCHTELSRKDMRADGLPNLGQPLVPRRWLTHSVFDHQAHRSLTCVACHEQAGTSNERKDVLMPRLANCQWCHQTGQGFARADCLECHQFHHRPEVSDWRGKMQR
jgi:hypothetical protein